MIVGTYAITIQASVPARNLSSAEKKTAALKEAMARKGWQHTELHLKGKDAA